MTEVKTRPLPASSRARAVAGWKRNIGFCISTATSVILVLRERTLVFLNVLAIFVNLCYLIVRHYYLQGLLSFRWAAYLH